ncbi:MAG: hypothetical protein F4Y11_02035 [Chloroflexi bacterium]|nr:hypothetical protein [Chloroflexota bacterium]
MNIEIDQEVFAALQDQAVPLVDTPNDVLRRVLGLKAIGEPSHVVESVDSQPHLPLQSSRRANRAPSGERSQRSGKARRAAGELLPLEAYCPHILRALLGSGGELRSREVPAALAPLIEPHLHSAENLSDREGDPIWQGRVGWAGSLCRKEGHLDRSAPRGIWRITAEGRKEADRHYGGVT